jgi:hypothetical protein
MSYRPFTDVWILARPKVKYYGAYPAGVLERAKVLLGASGHGPMLHVCGGHAKAYPNKRVVGPLDYTVDLDPDTHPDFLQDARHTLPAYPAGEKWPAILIDPPYTEADAEKYQPGAATFPTANALLRNALEAVAEGGRVGMLHYLLPQPPKVDVKFLACVGVIAGYNNRMRVFSVFEKLAAAPALNAVGQRVGEPHLTLRVTPSDQRI